jgi:hypothetical protein
MNARGLTMTTLVDAAKAHLEADDCQAAITLLDAHDHPDEAMRAYHELVQHAYWQRKDLRAVITLGQAGLARMQAQGERSAGRDEAATRAAREARSALSYNLASFCWPGWNEPGITIGEAELRAGYEAAQQHLALARELGLGDLHMARATWIAGALHLGTGQLDEARARFAESAQWAAKANNPSERLLACGYELLCSERDQLAGTAVDPWQEVTRQLAALPGGAELVTQLETAAVVFGRGHGMRS